jgi:hypothetical protein
VMKLARTIRFDPSDLNVFPRAADEGEWALVGTFCFAGLNEADINGKVKQAFSNGFLGLQSMGFSTLVSVVKLKSGDLEKIESRLCEVFLSEFGAPDKASAMTAVAEEITFMAELCSEHKTGTLLAIQRSLGEDGIQESFRSLSKPDSCAEQKIWTVVEDNSPADMNITMGSTVNIEK